MNPCLTECLNIYVILFYLCMCPHTWMQVSTSLPWSRSLFKVRIQLQNYLLIRRVVMSHGVQNFLAIAFIRDSSPLLSILLGDCNTSKQAKYWRSNNRKAPFIFHNWTAIACYLTSFFLWPWKHCWWHFISRSLHLLLPFKLMKASLLLFKWKLRLYFCFLFESLNMFFIL